MSKIYIGTSGWSYKEWGKEFFPPELPEREHLSYLANHFNTVEVNVTFYRLLESSAFIKWYKTTPRDFKFAVKVSRYITHIKRMHAVREAWINLYKHATHLKEKLGPFLLQFPPSFAANDHELHDIEKFLTAIKNDGDFRVAFEFRHKNCFREEVLNLLKANKIALVFANSSKYPTAPLFSPTDFVYFRLHGPKKMFSSSYSPAQLKETANTIQQFLKQNKDVYVYFNNDQHAHAPANAELLKELLKE